jgi:hypothetical protein
MQDPKYELLSLTALVGLWPEKRRELTELIGRRSAGRSLESRLKTSLRWAGFGRSAKSHEDH